MEEGRKTLPTKIKKRRKLSVASSSFKCKNLKEKLLFHDLSIFYFVHGNFVHFHTAHSLHGGIHTHGHTKIPTPNYRLTTITSMHFLYSFIKHVPFFLKRITPF